MWRHSIGCVFILGCLGGATDVPPDIRAELECPGDTSGICDDVPGAVLRAGAARASVVPSCFEIYDDVNGNDEYRSDEPFFDCGCDRLCAGDDGYPGPDKGEGDGVFQPIWLAGFQSARAARGVRDASEGLLGETDDLLATVAAFEQGNTSLAIVSVDGFGWMNDQVLAIRAELAEQGVSLDHLMFHSTHSHATPDTLGIYGRSITSTGFDAEYAAEMRATVVGLIQEAFADLKPVAMKTGKYDLSTTSEKGVANYLSDTRDPFIIDPWVYAAHFYDVETGEPVVNLVNWANHPEATADSQSLLSADFVHGLRTSVEKGYSWELAEYKGVGGLTVYLNGTVGGMMTPLRIENEDPDGNIHASHSYAKADAIGLQVGHYAVQAMLNGVEDVSPDLAFRKQSLYLPIDNVGFQAMYLVGVLNRPAFNYDPEKQLDHTNVPEILTEVNYIELGPVQILTLPGEVLPELAIGGYDGSHIHAPGYPLVDPGNPNPPDLSASPEGPYWKDKMSGDYRWIVGLANDEVGYIIPPYNFVIADSGGYILEAEGDHYEETNSLGPNTAPLLDEALNRMMGW
jgi:hypothetical protein